MSRRPVLDRTLRTVGFELVFHDGAAAAERWHGELSSPRHPAYLSVTSEYPLECEPLPLDPNGEVLELAREARVRATSASRTAQVTRQR